ncbi:hypothetical protein A1F94_009648 [Pyrenophora tritici-repentis]|uniref:Uncharacterized protein n=2 Tax=Pyrenophora tritici-repentis TaxID=45151 RepID=A0A2W1ESE2_9PLEO|nr:uncharacterized protein PTRG_08215 [Pyrenophora tritici-repentis Pt-1C-BFP]KAA8615853.1 hypothetical protein PtrV1_11249 [Pyrenophora tritici-repentis]EDU51134.1 conserved hypothetical protein [Pyrenophora tritici-repentis Pt-1C-BFP]KAF7443553.1 hypothetical protein A1F99_116270 [Pyrenophora tritici-repentis]KAF7566732.1 hypothetical protein PtrM4_150520 [Pyrenophora tritici-repentis]KAG9379292.1 hypothetical protein A1F94_009648 [Pyrenophora tritici-repentis]
MFQMTVRKRGRDDDSDSEIDEDRYIKKARPVCSEQANYGQFRFQSPATFPHRPSPSPPRLFTDIRSMTPAKSDYGGAQSPDSVSGGPVCLSRESSNMDYDMDMDEDDFDVRSQPPESPALYSSTNSFMRPAMLQSSLFNSEPSPSNGRLPTPIHATFKRGGMNGLGYPMSGSAGGLRTSDPSMQAPPPTWKSSRQEKEEDRSRRMPSPISEDDDIPDTPTALTQSQLSRLSVSHDYMETEESSNLVPPITPRTRKRSGALTGMGRFSMGYRDDCEKCRQRVPGHYSHYLP